MPLISITFHSYFLSIIYARASYLANDLATETATYTYICLYQYTGIRIFTVVPSMFNYRVSSSHHLLCYQHVQRVRSGCDKKKITLHRYFFRNLNFKNIVNFFKKTFGVNELKPKQSENTKPLGHVSKYRKVFNYSKILTQYLNKHHKA